MAGAALERASWRHPEGGAAVVAAGAWAMLLLPYVGGEAARAAHAQAHRDAPLIAGAAGWVLMTVAMMVPAALPAARFLALNALWARRRRTVALFLAAYVAVWAAFGAVAVPVAGLVKGLPGVTTGALLSVLLAAAALWELTSWKLRAVRACHLIAPVAPSGSKADAGCVSAGLIYGRRCVVACGPAMLAMAVAGHEALGLMAVLAVLLTAERAAARPAQAVGPAAAVLAIAALVVALLF
jgi:predicted metal-binding membrane protein